METVFSCFFGILAVGVTLFLHWNTEAGKRTWQSAAEEEEFKISTSSPIEIQLYPLASILRLPHNPCKIWLVFHQIK